MLSESDGEDQSHSVASAAGWVLGLNTEQQQSRQTADCMRAFEIKVARAQGAGDGAIQYSRDCRRLIGVTTAAG